MNVSNQEANRQLEHQRRTSAPAGLGLFKTKRMDNNQNQTDENNDEEEVLLLPWGDVDTDEFNIEVSSAFPEGLKASYDSPLQKLASKDANRNMKSFSASDSKLKNGKTSRWKIDMKGDLGKLLPLPAPPIMNRSRSALDFSDDSPPLLPVRSSSATKQKERRSFEYDRKEQTSYVNRLQEEKSRLIEAVQKMREIMRETKSRYRSQKAQLEELQQYCISLEGENSALHTHIDHLSAQLEFAYSDYGGVYYDSNQNYGSLPYYSSSDNLDVNHQNSNIYINNNAESGMQLDSSNQNDGDENENTEYSEDEEEIRQYEDLEPKPVLQLQ